MWSILTAITGCFIIYYVHSLYDSTRYSTVYYVRILPVCFYAICVIGSFSGSLLFYSYKIHVMDYDSYHCLFNMLYVLWLVMCSNLCRVGGGLDCAISDAIMHFIINVHNPEFFMTGSPRSSFHIFQNLFS